MNEFGRDPDGSSTNGFFNHRTNTECCRMAWSMVLGQAVQKPQVVERVVRQIDMAPSIGSWMGFECGRLGGLSPARVRGLNRASRLCKGVDRAPAADVSPGVA